MVGLAKKWVRWFISKTWYDEEWRVCVTCEQYKNRRNFWKDMVWIHNKTSSCKICRREKKRQYRDKYNRQQDVIYREHKRKLYIGDIIQYNNTIYNIISYREKQWYLCQNSRWDYLNLSTSDNKKYKKQFTIVKYNMAIPKTLAIARAWRQILALTKMTKVEKYYKIIDILTQLYDDNILTDNKNIEDKCQESTEKKE